MSALLFLLRLTTDAATVPDLFIFDNDWDLSEVHQDTYTTPEVVFLHPRAMHFAPRLLQMEVERRRTSSSQLR